MHEAFFALLTVWKIDVKQNHILKMMLQNAPFFGVVDMPCGIRFMGANLQRDFFPYPF